MAPKAAKPKTRSREVVTTEHVEQLLAQIHPKMKLVNKSSEFVAELANNLVQTLVPLIIAAVPGKRRTCMITDVKLAFSKFLPLIQDGFRDNIDEEISNAFIMYDRFLEEVEKKKQNLDSNNKET